MASIEKSVLLVVDDEAVSRYSKARVLRQAGFEVLEATTGEEALAGATERNPRLVILDVRLPDMDGWEVCKRIKGNPATSSILVLQTSATFTSESDTVRALEGGADGCLTEPIEPPVLVATVRALLRARIAEDAVREALGREQAARVTAEAANKSKDEFLATLSHELRSPLGGIFMWVELLRSGRLDEARKRHAYEAIERSARLQMRLIDDLLDVSRIISGKMVIDVGSVDLAATVESALESVRTAADVKAIELRSTVDPSLGPLSGDASRLHQVVWNLLSNAVKFTPQGGRVELTVERRPSHLEMTVTDTGQGIEPSFLPHIFERFRQADSSSTRAHSGLGLGLAIVRHLIELHGGTIEASSAGMGKGSTFTVRLPMASTPTAAPSRRAHASQPQTVALPTLAGIHVLVLDDERDARDAIATVLELCGAEVTAVASVADAVARIEGNRPDAIVSDIAMPAEDGFALIRRLRAIAGGATLPALALTAYASSADERRILDAGFNAYLTKPIDATELVATVSRLART
jgi:signal transduction histidine kinase